MKIKSIINVSTTASICIMLICCAAVKNPLPSNFINIKEIIPNIALDIRYYSRNNFIGKRIEGYQNPKSFMTKEAASALSKVQTDLNKRGLSLKIFDSYRPQKAVNHFIKWAKVLEDTIMKHQYYPDVNKKDLFALGYIAEKSGHSRGSTVDLTIINLANGEELDMGSPFDFFGQKSHHDYSEISSIQKENRILLKSIMEKYGFNAYSEEWWHYTLMNEPFPDTYFNFPVK